MNLTPVQQTKTYDLVIARIKAAILDGTFAPGSRLPSVKVLSETLGVGQAAVREATSALRVLRLIEVRQGDGTFVATLNTSDIRKSIAILEETSKADSKALLELRMSIETGTCYYAALRRTKEHLQEIESILSTMQEDSGNAEIGEKADWAFHYAIARASHNPYMQSLMDTISEQIQSALITSRLALYRIRGEDEVLLEQHRRIFEAIRDRSPSAASDAMQLHLRHVFTQLFGGDFL